MIARLRARHERGQKAKQGIPVQPEIREPTLVPSAEQRQRKEQAWFSSITGGRLAGSRRVLSESESDLPIDASDSLKQTRPATLSGKEDAHGQEQLSSGSKKQIKSNASMRSLTSKGSFLGLRRRKSSASMRTTGEDSPDSSYAMVEPVPPMPAWNGAEAAPRGSTSSASPALSTLGTPGPSKPGKPLAARLQELSVAHSDGLLDDEEYRMLKAALLEKFAAEGQQELNSNSLQMGSLGSQKKSEATLSPLRPPKPPANSYADTYAAPSRPSLGDGASSVRSGRSGRSSTSRSRFMGRFGPLTHSRQSSALKEDWQSLNEAHRTSLALDSDREETLSINHGQHPSHPSDLPVRDARHNLLPPLTLQQQSPGRPSGRSTPVDSSSRSARSIQAMPRSQAQSSSASVYSASSAGNKSHKFRYPLSAAGSIHSHGFETDDDPYAEATPQQIRYEMSQLSAERTRVTDQFENLISQARARVPSAHQQSSSTGSDAPSAAASLSPSHASYSSPNHTSSMHAKRSSASSLSIFRSSPRPRQTNAPTSGLALPSTPAEEPRAFESAEQKEESKAHLKEAVQLGRKRDKVRQRYDTQLEFLQVKLQGAELRQSLKR